MKKYSYALLVLVLFAVFAVGALCLAYAKKAPIAIVIPETHWQYNGVQPCLPDESYVSVSDPMPDPPSDPPVAPPVDPPIIVSPTDPATEAYWLYYTPDAALGTDRDTLNLWIQNAGKVTPISQIKSEYTAAEVRAMIEAYRAPVAGYREDGSLHTESFFKDVAALCDLAGIKDVTARTALTLTRADVRSFPTEIPCFSDNLMQDLFQEAQLPVGTPILILHESADGKFCFVISYFYSGWIAAEQVMTVDAEQFLYFAEPEQFAVVTVPMTESGLTMGTILPLAAQNEETVLLLLPDWEMGTKTVEIPLAQVSIGYLDATVHNLLKLAFSYLGTPYSWGDRGNGVDCSGLYVNVMRCMGIFLPRNTGDMRSITEAEYISLQAGIPSDLRTPCLIFRKGHVMLYLGMYDGLPYVLHAPESGRQVTAEALLRTDNLLTALCLAERK